MSESRKLTPTLPPTVEEFMKRRKTPQVRTLNHDVEQIHLALWKQDAYRKYFTPLWRSETIEGSFIADEVMAAQQVRQYAEESEDYQLAKDAKIDAIQHSLRVVLSRYEASRRQRQLMLSDGRVGPGSEDHDLNEDNGNE